ncbi:hypothetical protein AQULUS_02420 [Aquicella lusitana]|uniref:Uncharacterized protein n=1 Tax=Aquicella lusitana TaxID=254246 RepID=A0A370GL79_9COXI|nr:hypothetical protein C8D86_10910 [Aquicella lusitana]VVC72530.1 hypothetical protein AQULUS_02420 [Aquicella lusitana]
MVKVIYLKKLFVGACGVYGKIKRGPKAGMPSHLRQYYIKAIQ